MKIGQRVAFQAASRKSRVIGTVRAIKNGEARVDDGDPINHDPHTNGWHISAWVRLMDLTVVP